MHGSRLTTWLTLSTVLVVFLVQMDSACAGIFVAGSMYLKADAQFGDEPHDDTDVSSDTLVGVPASLEIRARASAAINEIGESIEVNGNGFAEWFSADEGTVFFSDYGWIFNTSADNPVQSANLNDHTDGDDWSYTFIAGVDEAFTMKYDVVGTPTTFGLQGWDLLIDGNGIGLLNTNDPTISGSYTLVLNPGQQYTISLRNNANISTDGFLSGYSGSMDGAFKWSIHQVPEPASITIMAIGILFGGAVRRKLSRGVA